MSKRPISHNFETKERCVRCGSIKIMKNYENVCSKFCLDNKLLIDNLTIPKLFLISLYNKNPNKEDRYKKIEEFSKRHGYMLNLVIEKVKAQYKDFFPPYI